ncbi:MAG TPA: hypothetical protein V6D15_22885 [Oculatellaceae cyanobacterium]
MSITFVRLLTTVQGAKTAVFQLSRCDRQRNTLRQTTSATSA